MVSVGLADEPRVCAVGCLRQLSSRLSKERRPVCGSAINTIVLNFPVVDGGVATRYSGKPQIRGPVRNRPDQPHQSEAGRQANYAEGAATRRERCRSDGSSPAPRVGKESAPAQVKAPKTSTKKPRKASSGQKEMLMPITGKEPPKETCMYRKRYPGC
jgi:hypothetical protein